MWTGDQDEISRTRGFIVRTSFGVIAAIAPRGRAGRSKSDRLRTIPKAEPRSKTSNFSDAHMRCTVFVQIQFQHGVSNSPVIQSVPLPVSEG